MTNAEMVKATIAHEQRRMNKAIRKAVVSFTEETGLTVTRVDFTVDTALTVHGAAILSNYHSFRATIAAAS